jgi:hypothetical protein
MLINHQNLPKSTSSFDELEKVHRSGRMLELKKQLASLPEVQKLNKNFLN